MRSHPKPMRRALIAGVLCLAASVATAAAPTLAPLPAPRSTDLPPESRDLLRDSRLSGVTGWQVRDLDTGVVLDAWRADRPFVPASVAKLPTAAFALDRLGPDHRFETRVLATAPAVGGRVAGDLVLAGGADPELDTDALDALAARVAARVARVDGALVADPGELGTIAAISPTQPPEASYNPGVSGLGLNFNRVRVEWTASAAKAGVGVFAQAARLRPETDAVVVKPAARLSRILEARPAEADGIDRWRIHERVLRRSGGRWLPVRQPDHYAARVFADRAGAKGLGLTDTRVAPGAAEDAGHLLARHESAPLADILRRMLFHSTNVTAEVVGLAASRTAAADPLVAGTAPGSTVPVIAARRSPETDARTVLPASAAMMNDWAAARAGFAPDDPGFDLANHSGLSIASRLSPERTVDFLMAEARLGRAVPRRVDPRLPRGVARILRAKNVAAPNDGLDHARLAVVAKTGTMDFVRGLAGYVATPGGRRLAFAIFSNDLARRDGSRSGSRTWLGRARALEAALVRSWARMADAEIR